MNRSLRIGLIGVAGTLVLNLAGLLLLKKPAAQFFTDGWWSTWFPCYAVWLALMIVGMMRGRKREVVRSQ